MNDQRVPFPFALLRFWFCRIFWMWLIIGFFISLIQVIQCAIAQDNEVVKMTIAFIERMPGFVKEAVGSEVFKVSSLTGFIAITYQHPMVLALYMTFSVSVSTGLLAGHVQDGNMELILSRSATKNQVYICACVLTLTGIILLVGVMFMGTVIGLNLCSYEKQVSVWPFFRAASVGSLLATATAGVGLFAGASLPSRGKAVGFTISFLIISYFIALISQWWPRVEFIGPASIFYYVDPPKILSSNTWPIRDMSVLATILILTVIAGGIIWNKRDLPL